MRFFPKENAKWPDFSYLKDEGLRENDVRDFILGQGSGSSIINQQIDTDPIERSLSKAWYLKVVITSN